MQDRLNSQTYKNYQILIYSLFAPNLFSSLLPQIVDDSNTRNNFVNVISNFTKKFELNGIDIDWEYPNKRGGVPADKVGTSLSFFLNIFLSFYFQDNFIQFLKELRDNFGKELLITAAVSGNPNYINSSYDIPQMNEYVIDHIIISFI